MYQANQENGKYFAGHLDLKLTVTYWSECWRQFFEACKKKNSFLNLICFGNIIFHGSAAFYHGMSVFEKIYKFTSSQTSLKGICLNRFYKP